MIPKEELFSLIDLHTGEIIGAEIAHTLDELYEKAENPLYEIQTLGALKEGEAIIVRYDIDKYTDDQRGDIIRELMNAWGSDARESKVYFMVLPKGVEISIRDLSRWAQENGYVKKGGEV